MATLHTPSPATPLGDTERFSSEIFQSRPSIFHLDALEDAIAISAIERGELFAAHPQNDSTRCAHSSNSNEVRIVTRMQRRENEFPDCLSHRANIAANPLCS
jgi:hypothetical protein